MNITAQTTTIKGLLTGGAWRGQDTAWSAYLLQTLHRRNLSWDAFLSLPVRIPERSLVELVRAEQRDAEDGGFPRPCARLLMADGIADSNSYPAPGNGNRFRRRLEALNMGARRKCRNPKGWDTVDTYCPDSIPAAPEPVHHLNCA